MRESRPYGSERGAFSNGRPAITQRLGRPSRFCARGLRSFCFHFSIVPATVTNVASVALWERAVSNSGVLARRFSVLGAIEGCGLDYDLRDPVRKQIVHL